MIDNKIYAWNPIDNIPKQLYLHSLQHESGVLTIYLSTIDVDRELSIVFYCVIACQSVIETCSLERLEKDTLLSTEWPLFFATDSIYVDQLIAQSYGMYEKNELTHYMITHGTGIIDVVCASQNPLVHWVNNLGSAAGSGKIKKG